MIIQTSLARRTAASAIVFVALLAGALAFAPRAAAALPGGVTCYGDYCSGQDPVATGCYRDAITLAAIQLDTGAGMLELRWSPTCETNWARWDQYPTGWCANCNPDALLAVQDTGYTQKLDWFDHGTVPADGSTSWTPMIYSPVHKVYAEVDMPCGSDSLLGSAFDCLINEEIKTPAY